jgi:aerobic-type carbon monoxide dehydrogenase small subunit (CoxS/CutS family)
MTLALDAVGTRITTVEGLAVDGRLDPVQESFVRHDGLQCGYCTPGLVMACRALLNDTPKPTLEQIKRGLSGNICRCGAYTNIFNAALEASGQPPITDQKGA